MTAELLVRAGTIESMHQPDRAQRREAVRRRDGDTCAWCGRRLTGQVTATTDHVIPKVHGGPSWAENEVATCRRCNGDRGHRSAVDWLEECERRGWSPDADRLHRVLTSLAAAIDERGGQRRARPHLEAQLRRLRRRVAG